MTPRSACRPADRVDRRRSSGSGSGRCPWAAPRRFGTPIGALARALGVPFAVGAVAACGLRTLTRYHEPSGWAGLAAEMSLSALAMLALSVALLLTPEDRALWRRSGSAVAASDRAGAGRCVTAARPGPGRRSSATTRRSAGRAWT